MVKRERFEGFKYSRVKATLLACNTHDLLGLTYSVSYRFFIFLFALWSIFIVASSWLIDQPFTNQLSHTSVILFIWWFFGFFTPQFFYYWNSNYLVLSIIADGSILINRRSIKCTTRLQRPASEPYWIKAIRPHIVVRAWRLRI